MSAALDGRDRAMVIVGASVALATLVPVALYQTGLLESLPDPPGSIFDSERLVKSSMAHPFGVPDSLPGLASYGATLTLAILARRSSRARTLLGYKVAGDSALAAFNVVRQVVSFRRLCSWCTGTALATVLIAYGGRHAVQQSLEAHVD